VFFIKAEEEVKKRFENNVKTFVTTLSDMIGSTKSGDTLSQNYFIETIIRRFDEKSKQSFIIIPKRY